MALRIGRLAGNGPGLWLRMQQAYDLWHTERQMKKSFPRLSPSLRLFPTPDQAKELRFPTRICGLVLIERVGDLLAFIEEEDARPQDHGLALSWIFVVLDTQP